MEGKTCHDKILIKQTGLHVTILKKAFLFREVLIDFNTGLIYIAECEPTPFSLEVKIKINSYLKASPKPKFTKFTIHLKLIIWLDMAYLLS